MFFFFFSLFCKLWHTVTDLNTLTPFSQYPRLKVTLEHDIRRTHFNFHKRPRLIYFFYFIYFLLWLWITLIQWWNTWQRIFAPWYVCLNGWVSLLLVSKCRSPAFSPFTTILLNNFYMKKQAHIILKKCCCKGQSDDSAIFWYAKHR